MNKPIAHPEFDQQALPPYEQDGYGWAIAQARLIRDRKFDLVDWDNVAEEIEGMARSERRALESALRIVLLHQLKWRYQPVYRSRSWANSIREHLQRFDDELEDNPSLTSQLGVVLVRAYRQARHEAARETGLSEESFPMEPPSWEEIRGPLEP